VPAGVTSAAFLADAPSAVPSVAAKTHALAEITAFVVQTIAAQAGYATHEVNLNETLGEGLGLDSLIVADTAQRLHRKYELWVPKEVDFASILTVKDLVQSIVGVYEAGAGASPAADPVVVDASPKGPSPTANVENVQPEAFIDRFPEVLATKDRIDGMSQSDAGNPFYLEVEGAIGSHCSIGGRQLISFSSYNYLGLSTHPRIAGAAKQAIETYGTSVSAARILSGNRPLHNQLESAIAGLLHVEDSIVMVGGHSTNMGIIPHLLDERDIVFHDALVHDSILRGIQASGAARHSFGHNRADELERALTKRRGQFRRALIIVEGIYSMDGDLPPLAKVVELKERFGATLMVDEAHSIGVLGRHGGGVCEELGIDPSTIDIHMGTLSKSFASCGGYLAGSSRFIESLRYTLSGYIFSAGLTPANAAAALESIRVMGEEPNRLIQLRQNSKYFLARATELGFDCGTASGVPVVPTIFADSKVTLSVARFMFDNGVMVNPIIFPAVAESLARLRFFITSEHTPELIDETLSTLKRAVRSADTVTV
jgi:8-amino-7-oxononanoate synthase